MPATYDLILKNGTVWTPSGPVETSVGVRDGVIVGLGVTGDAGETIDCTGLTVLPGVIDSQVHFREPGLEQKEDLEIGQPRRGAGRRHGRVRDAQHQAQHRFAPMPSTTS